MASFVAIWGKDRNQTDDLYLLLISADGLVPIAITLYTLLLIGHAQPYDVFLAGISALLASITGFGVVAYYSSTKNISSTYWPASCGGQSPQWICDFSISFEVTGRPDLCFVGGATVIDVLICVLILGYCLPRFTPAHSKTLHCSRIINKKTRIVSSLVLQILTILSLLVCAGIEIWFLVMVLEKGNQYTSHNWSFGQIVGITIWFAVIVDLIRYELCRSNTSRVQPRITRKSH